MFGSSWLECSICGQHIELCKCTDQDKAAYEQRAALLRQAANQKREDFNRLLQKVRGDDKVVQFDAEVEQSYDNLPKLEANRFARLDGGPINQNPAFNLRLDLTKPAIVVKDNCAVWPGGREESAIEEAFPIVLSNEQKHYMMLALGFKHHGKSIWTHPDLGEGRGFHFNLATDNMDEIVHRLSIHDTFKLKQ